MSKGITSNRYLSSTPACKSGRRNYGLCLVAAAKSVDCDGVMVLGALRDLRVYSLVRPHD